MTDFERRVVGFVVRNLFLNDRAGGRWEAPPHLPHERVEFEGNTGATVRGHWFPAEKPKGTVVLAHPDRRYGKHWFVRDGWVDFLHENGFDVLTFDFPGYGESEGPARYFHEDVAAAAKLARRWAGGLPVHVVGLSQGAYAAANAAPRLDFVESMILESPYPSVTAWYGKGPRRWLLDAFNAVFPATAAALRADLNVAQTSAKRVLIVGAGVDEVTPLPLTRAVADAAPRERTEYLEIPDARHLEPFAKSPQYRAAVLRTLKG